MNTTHPTRLTFLSWNIYRNYRPRLVEHTLRRHLAAYCPDAVLIQEAPVYDTHRFSDLALFEGYDAFFAPMHEVLVPRRRLTFKRTGQLTLSHRDVRHAAVHELPALRRWGESGTAQTDLISRIALYTQLQIDSDTTVGLYNIHLENRSMPAGRLRQVEDLLDVIRHKRDDVVVVGGDFNTFLTNAFEPCLRSFKEAGFTNLFRRSKRRWIPRLDYFMVKGAADARGLQLPGRGSDHAPILAVVDL